MGSVRIILAAVCVWLVAGCERPPVMSLAPRIVRAPSDELMEQVAVYSAFLVQQVPLTKWGGGRRMEGLLIREPISYSGHESELVLTNVFQGDLLLVRAGLGGVDRSYPLAQDTRKNFYAATARTDDLFGRDEFSGPFIVLSDDELNSQFQMEPCYPMDLCGLRLIAHDLPNSGGLWGFSHIGFSRDRRQALVYYRNDFWGEGGVALLEKGAGGWSIVVESALSVS